MLKRLEEETGSYLADWQAGFRKTRGCRDNILTLRTLLEDILEQGEELVATFIDYSAAFDSVSHRFLDEALKKAGASNKSRAMFRAMYKVASAHTVVADTDGGKVRSETFQINRGVVQGDIVSPLYFILALQLILERHDTSAGKGVQFGGHTVHTLGYADDAALLDKTVAQATKRVSEIAQGSRKDADMEISTAKTEVMHVREQGRVPKATAQEAKAVCKVVCPNIGCNKVFFNVHGAKCHAGRCKWRDTYNIERILAVSGATGSARRRFKIRWAGYGPEHDT
jgi:hypothetical protein